jgi:hypothetical protein
MVGGNIRGYSRTMNTTSALETSKKDLALALGPGPILILPSVTVTAFLLAAWSTRGRSWSYPRAYASQNGRYRKQRACGPVEVHADSVERQQQLCTAGWCRSLLPAMAIARGSQSNIMSASSHRIARWLPTSGGLRQHPSWTRLQPGSNWPSGRAGKTATINQNHCSVPACFSRTSSVSSAPVVATGSPRLGSDQRPPSRNRLARLYRPEILRLTLFRRAPYIRPRPTPEAQLARSDERRWCRS